MTATSVVIDSVGSPQSLRWHEGALWYTDLAEDAIFRWTPTGGRELVARVPSPNGLGFLPDGSLRCVSLTETMVYRVRPAGQPQREADLTGVVAGRLNDAIADAQGRYWIGNFGFDYFGALDSGGDIGLYGDDRVVSTRLVRMDLDGALSPEGPPLLFPNGCTWSPSGDALLACETLAFRIARIPLGPAGLTDNYGSFARFIDEESWVALLDTSAQGELRRNAIAADATSLGAGIVAPEALAFAPDGSVFVADAAAPDLVRLNPSGGVIERISLRGRSVGVTVAEGGAVFVATVQSLDEDELARNRSATIEVVVPNPTYHSGSHRFADGTPAHFA